MNKIDREIYERRVAFLLSSTAPRARRNGETDADYKRNASLDRIRRLCGLPVDDVQTEQTGSTDTGAGDEGEDDTSLLLSLEVDTSIPNRSW